MFFYLLITNIIVIRKFSPFFKEVHSLIVKQIDSHIFILFI